jgi:hypothetical protein
MKSLPKKPGPGAEFWEVITYLMEIAAFLADAVLDLEYRLGKIMHTEADIQASLDQMKVTLTGEDGMVVLLTNGLANLNTMIADLQKQVAAGSPATQPQIDALAEESSALATQTASQLTELQAIVGAMPAPPPPAPPVVVEPVPAPAPPVVVEPAPAPAPPAV